MRFFKEKFVNEV